MTQKKPEKAKEAKPTYSGALNFKRVGQGRAVFEADSAILGSRVIELPVDCLPKNYDPNEHEVSGNFSFNITVKKKKKKE